MNKQDYASKNMEKNLQRVLCTTACALKSSPTAPTYWIKFIILVPFKFLFMHTQTPDQ